MYISYLTNKGSLSAVLMFFQAAEQGFTSHHETVVNWTTAQRDWSAKISAREWQWAKGLSAAYISVVPVRSQCACRRTRLCDFSPPVFRPQSPDTYLCENVSIYCSVPLSGAAELCHLIISICGTQNFPTGSGGVAQVNLLCEESLHLLFLPTMSDQCSSASEQWIHVKC